MATEGRSQTAAARPTLRRRIAAHLALSQHRNAYCLLLNNVLAAATGLLFWMIFARLLGLAESEIGIGYAIVSLGTIIGVVAKGGLDTAVMRGLPGTGQDGLRLYRFAIAVGIAAALLLAVGLAAVSLLFSHNFDPLGWSLAAAIGVLLLATWLQDARFLAQGDAWPSLKRNLVLSAARLIGPLVVVSLAIPRPVPVSLAIALALSLLMGIFLAQRLVPTPAVRLAPPRRAFIATALRNASGSAAEFLPGLLLAPLVLAVAGARPAAYFGMAWTAATLLFLASSALSRSALAEIVRKPGTTAQALRRAVLQHLILVLPAAVVVAALAPQALGFFGPAYAAAGSSTLILLAASTVLVAPGNLYLAVLRARDSPVALAAYPAAMIATLLLLAPTFLSLWGLPGVALAWILANAPLGAVGLWRLRQEARMPVAGTLASHPVATPASEAATEPLGGAP